MLRPGSTADADRIDRDDEGPLVLIVDDDHVFRTVVRAHLDYEGYRVEEAESGASAIARFDEIAPDIVLLDIMMPGLDGFKTCAALRKLQAGRQIPIVMMTGMDDRESIERAYDCGATDFVIKPVNSFVLSRRLQYILRANQYLVHFDSLTGLPKRNLFLEHLSMAIAGARRHDHFVAVLFLALDNFKRFNETLGHKVGDEILHRVGLRLGELRSSDYFARNEASESSMPAPADDHPVARFGSDEFMILFPDIHHEQDMVLVAEKVRESLARPFDIGGDEIYVTASIGISAYPLDGDEPQLLVERAAAAASQGKQAGRNCYQFYGQGLNTRTQTRLSIENQLRRSIDRDQLAIHYQPKLDLRDNRISGFEALVRMPAAETGEIGPTDFVSIAEETGLIGALGDWVFRRACEEFGQLRSDGCSDARIAINLSAGQFRTERLCQVMLEALDRTGLEAQAVELELTEGILLANTDASIGILHELREAGFRIAVDDFGTGYSSLSYLTRFPLDVLKIDKSFIDGVHKNANDAAIVETIIDLGRRLSLEVVAEGVEHPEQLEFLRDRGCQVVQGFLVSRPLPHDEVSSFVDRWEAGPDGSLMRMVEESLAAGERKT